MLILLKNIAIRLRFLSRNFFLQKYALFLAESSLYTTNFVSRYASHLYRDAFAEVLGSGFVGTPPKRLGKTIGLEMPEM